VFSVIPVVRSFPVLGGGGGVGAVARGGPGEGAAGGAGDGPAGDLLGVVVVAAGGAMPACSAKFPRSLLGTASSRAIDLIPFILWTRVEIPTELSYSGLASGSYAGSGIDGADPSLGDRSRTSQRYAISIAARAVIKSGPPHTVANRRPGDASGRT